MKKFIYLFFLIIITNYICGPVNSATDCKYQLSNINHTRDLSPGSAAHATITGFISRGTISSSDLPRCHVVAIFMNYGQSGSFQRFAKRNGSNDTMNYNLHSTVVSPSIIKDYGDANNNSERLIEVLMNENTIYHTPFIIKYPIMNNTLVRAGTYSDKIEMKAYSWDQINPLIFEYQKKATLSLRFHVQKYAQLSLVPLGAPHNPAISMHTLDFGNMVSGKQMAVDLRVLTNAENYKIKVTSLNGGKLKYANYSVGYAINFENDPVWYSLDTINGVNLIQGGISPNIQGRRHRIRVRLGSVPPHLPSGGNYSDWISFTVSIQ